MTYIRSLLEYANILWDNCSIENKRNLESIQIEAARIITGATKLCSIQKLYDDYRNTNTSEETKQPQIIPVI